MNRRNPAHHRHGQTFCFQGIVDLKPGCAHEAKSHLGEEYFLIKSGELTVELYDEKHVLTSGDAAVILIPREPVTYFMLVYYAEPA
ncbi:cupin domain-containing protein [Bacillus amyloliquefaciens]|uniref:cupin domain-containing protein n=1 Tax=Bacillus TaxID=1386 RepID=UPI002B059CD8|nr:cupin domain-containing protein [Bacillus sp. H1F1]